MTHMRRGFTMIELIFVIVIIGILAAVAIPKLAATRDDAKISNIIANTRTVMGDMASFYTSQGSTVWSTAEIGKVTNVPLYTDAACGTQAAATDAAIGTFYICDEPNTAISPCITLVASDTNVSVTATTGGTICTGVQLDPAIQGIAGTVSGTAKETLLGGVGVIR